jgi:hypothetical protein
VSRKTLRQGWGGVNLILRGGDTHRKISHGTSAPLWAPTACTLYSLHTGSAVTCVARATRCVTAVRLRVRTYRMRHGEALVGNGGPAWWTSRVASPQVNTEAGGVCPVVPAGVPWVEARATTPAAPGDASWAVWWRPLERDASVRWTAHNPRLDRTSKRGLVVTVAGVSGHVDHHPLSAQIGPMPLRRDVSSVRVRLQWPHWPSSWP